MPLTFDLPLDQLKTYSGINPRPHDFNDFWEKGIKEMRSINPQIKFVPSKFQAHDVECFHLYFTGVGGARVHAKLLRPSRFTSPRPAILMFHGYGGNSGDWSEKLSYVSQGFVVAALDCRGQSGLSEDNGRVAGNTLHGQIIRGLEDALRGEPDKLLFRQIFLDTAQLAKIVMEMSELMRVELEQRVVARVEH